MLVGSVVAENHSILSYNGNWYNQLQKWVFGFGYMYDIDIYWGTKYEGGLYTAKDVPADYSTNFNFERYSLIVASQVKAGLIIEFFGVYKIQPTIYIQPFTVKPFEIWGIWFRPESARMDLSLFDINFYLSSTLEFFKIYLGVQEQTKTCGKSIANWIDNSNTNKPWPDSENDCYYLDGYQPEYIDSFYQINFIDRFLPDYYKSGMYGEIPLFNYWLRQKWDW